MEWAERVGRHSGVSRPARWIGRHAPVLVAVGVAGCVELLVNVQWSFANCSDAHDGPLPAVFGFPFPYTAWSQVSSLEYTFMPHVYLLNLLILSGVFLLIVRATMRGRSSDRRAALGFVGLSLCVLVALWIGGLLASGLLRPASSLGLEPHVSYTDLQPVGVSATQHYDCTPLN